MKDSHFKNQACCDCLALLEDIRKRQEFYTGELIMEISEVKDAVRSSLVEIATLKNEKAALETENAALKAVAANTTVTTVDSEMESLTNELKAASAAQ